MFTVALDPELTDGHCTALCLNREELAYLTAIFGWSSGAGYGMTITGGSEVGFYEVLMEAFRDVVNVAGTEVYHSMEFDPYRNSDHPYHIEMNRAKMAKIIDAAISKVKEEE